MILTLNAGNTLITMGLYTNQTLAFASSVSIAANQTKYELAFSIKSMFALHQYDTSAIDGVIVSFAAPFLESVLMDALQLITDKKPLVVGPGIKTGLHIAIDNPAQLGSDIVASCVAAISKYSTPMIIIRLGTAIVMTVINAKNQLVGCAIAPGMEISFRALSQQAAQLPHIRIQQPKHAIGLNTIEAMQSGIFYGTVAMLDGMIYRLQEELKDQCQVIMTGDMAKDLCPLMECDAIFYPNLILDGLFLLYSKNQK